MEQPGLSLSFNCWTYQSLGKKCFKRMTGAGAESSFDGRTLPFSLRQAVCGQLRRSMHRGALNRQNRSDWPQSAQHRVPCGQNFALRGAIAVPNWLENQITLKRGFRAGLTKRSGAAGSKEGIKSRATLAGLNS